MGSPRRKFRVKWQEVAEFRFDTDDESAFIAIEYTSTAEKPVLRRIFDAYNASLSDILRELVDRRTRFGRGSARP